MLLKLSSDMERSGLVRGGHWCIQRCVGVVVCLLECLSHVIHEFRQLLEVRLDGGCLLCADVVVLEDLIITMLFLRLL